MRHVLLMQTRVPHIHMHKIHVWTKFLDTFTFSAIYKLIVSQRRAHFCAHNRTSNISVVLKFQNHLDLTRHSQCHRYTSNAFWLPVALDALDERSIEQKYYYKCHESTYVLHFISALLVVLSKERKNKPIMHEINARKCNAKTYPSETKNFHQILGICTILCKQFVVEVPNRVFSQN